MILKIKNKYKNLKIYKKNLMNCCENVLNQEKKTGNVSLIFVDKKEIKKIHRKFMNIDSETDVISFEYDCENYILDDSIIGDIFVSVDAALEYAKLNDITFNEELLRYVIHGILHCIGYNDSNTKPRKKMLKKQEEYVSQQKQNIIAKIV